MSDIDLDEDSVSPKTESPQDVSNEEEGDDSTRNKEFCVASQDTQPTKTQQILSNISNISSSSSGEDDDGLFSLTQNIANNNNNEGDFDVTLTRGSTNVTTPWNPEANITTTQRRRRKLPEIPKNKKCEYP